MACRKKNMQTFEFKLEQIIFLPFFLGLFGKLSQLSFACRRSTKNWPRWKPHLQLVSKPYLPFLAFPSSFSYDLKGTITIVLPTNTLHKIHALLNAFI